MPIRKENKGLYPENWGEIRHKVLGRSDNCCEICGVRNGAVGYRNGRGDFIQESEITGVDVGKRVTIVLTVMHLDHNPSNCDLDNLRAACQKCHNSYDAPTRRAGIKRRHRQEYARHQESLFPENRRVADQVQTSHQKPPNGPGGVRKW